MTRSSTTSAGSGTRLLVPYAAIVSATVALVALFFALREVAPPTPFPGSAALFRLVAVALLAAALVGLKLIWSRSHPDPDGSTQPFPVAASALTAWALVDGLVTLGAVCWYLTADYLAAGLLIGVGLALMVALRPAVWEGPEPRSTGPD